MNLWIGAPIRQRLRIISRTLDIKNRLKRYLPIFATEFTFPFTIRENMLGFWMVNNIQFQKRALRIMTNSKYNTNTDPIFKSLEMLNFKDIFDVQCLKLWYKFGKTNNLISTSPCLHINTNYMKRKPADSVCSICIPRVLLVPVMDVGFLSLTVIWNNGFYNTNHALSYLNY